MDCKTISILTIVSLVVAVIGLVLSSVGISQDTHCVGDDTKVPLNALTITGAALSTLGGSLFLIFAIIWGICETKK